MDAGPAVGEPAPAMDAVLTADAERVRSLSYRGDLDNLVKLLRRYFVSSTHDPHQTAAVSCATSHSKHWSALHQATYHARWQHPAIVAKLVAYGVDPTIRNDAGKTAADIAKVCNCG